MRLSASVRRFARPSSTGLRPHSALAVSMVRQDTGAYATVP